LSSSGSRYSVVASNTISLDSRYDVLDAVQCTLSAVASHLSNTSCSNVLSSCRQTVCTAVKHMYKATVRRYG